MTKRSLNRSWIVTIQSGNAKFAKVWDPSRDESGFEIGYPVRWVLERTENGAKIRSSENPALERVLDDETLSRAAKLELTAPGQKGSALVIELRPSVTLPPVYDTHPGTPGALRIYPVRGDWTRDAVTLTDRFDAISGGRKLFRLRAESASRAKLQAFDREIEISLERGRKSITLKAKEARSFLNSELAGATLSVGTASWKLDTLRPSASLSDRRRLVAADAEEEALLKRSLGATAILLLFLLGISSFWHGEVAPAPAPQKTRILLTKKVTHGLMTAAPKGNKHAHDTSIGHHGKPSGTSMARKASPVKKQAAVASHSPHKAAPVHAPAPTHAHAQSAHHVQHVQHAQSHAASHHSVAKAIAKAAGPAHSKPTARAVHAPHSQLAARSTAPSAAMAELARAVRSSGSSSAGGMSSLEGRLASGSDATAEAQSLAGSRSGIRGGHSSGQLEAGSVSVAEFGGGGSTDSGTPGYGRGSNARVSGQGHSLVSLDTSASDVEDGLTKDQVGRVIHAHMSEIRYCYDAAVLRNPDAEGKLEVRFTIGGNGIVKSSSIARTNVGDQQLSQCVVSHLSRWKFPKPRGGVDVTVKKYPFIFKTLGR